LFKIQDIQMRKIGNCTAEQLVEGMDLSGRTVLITGCNSGIGLETMRVLALKGARVFGAARTIEKASEACLTVKGETIPIACELSDPSSIRAVISSVKEPLDVIIANAGVMALQKLILIYGVEAHMFINHVGHSMLVMGLLSQLKPKGRVLILSSAAHTWARGKSLNFDDLAWTNKPYKPWTAYAYSKLANILFAKELAKRVLDGQTVNSIHHGIIDTKLWRHVPGESQKYKLNSPEYGAAQTVFLASDPTVETISGEYFSGGAASNPSSYAQDDKLAKQLWAVTEKIISNI
jgi:WW domain-containing oxidoreductase